LHFHRFQLTSLSWLIQLRLRLNNSRRPEVAVKNKDEERSRRYPVVEHMRWQILEWKIQRIGYACLFTIVLLGACGLFSKGVLSDTGKATDDGSLQVEYERFGRLDSDMAMTIRVKPQQEHFTLKISGEEMDNFQIQSL